MFGKITFIPAFLFVLVSHAQVPCEDPFAGERTQFVLTEPLSCDPTQPVYQLQVDPNAYLQPSCVGNNKVLDLYLNNGQNIRSFSGEQTGQAGWGPLQVSSACTGKTLFTIMPGSQIPGTGFVNPEEDTVNSVTLRNNEDQVIASATKSLIRSGSCGNAYWNVTNSPNLSPQVMAYLLALKDNALFSCTATTAPIQSESISWSTALVATIAAVAIAVPFTLIAWVCLKGKQPWSRIPPNESAGASIV